LMFIWPVISHSFSLDMTLGHQIFMIYCKHLFTRSIIYWQKNHLLHHEHKQGLDLKTSSYIKHKMFFVSPSSSWSSHIPSSPSLILESQLRQAASVHSFQVV
jgi:hypothetical protein